MENQTKPAGIKRQIEKLVLKMKLTLTIFLFCLAGAAASTYSQNTRLDIKIENGNMVELVKQIEAKSEFMFYYQREELSELDNLTLEAQNATVMEILDKVTKGTGFDYTVIDRYIVVRKVGDDFGNDFLATAKENVVAQQRSVSGRVTDSSNQPLPGVTVVLKGTTQGTVTNADGNYTLTNIPDDATLVFSFVGMRTQEVVVSSQTTINVRMDEETIGLEEVVAVGYRTKNLSELSSSVSVINEEKLQTGMTSSNLGTMLQGKVPGLVISNNSGHPQRGTNVVIRGVGSIGAGYNPLYVVDGIIGGTYHPSDIESITVLKDAAATGLYGSRAANGVIVITTKKGKSGETKVNYNSTFGPTFHFKGNLEMMNSQELYDNRREAAQNYYNDQIAAQHPDFINQTFDQYFNRLVPSSVLNTDSHWPSLLSRTGFVNKHNINVSGGNEKTNFFISGNFYDEIGTLIHEEYREYNVRANLETQISNKLRLFYKMNARTARYPNDYTTGQEAATVQYYINVPWDPVYEEDGVTPYNPYKSGFWYGNAKSNYFYYREHFSDITNNFNFNNDLKLEFKINEFISLSTSNRFGLGATDWTQLLDKYHPAAEFEGGRLSQTYSYSYSLLTSNLLSFDKNFGDHNISGLIGQEYSYSKGQNTAAVGANIPIGLEALSATSQPKSVGGTITETGFKSYFSVIDYNYLFRYFLVGSVRTDASSRFGVNNKWATFYSIGGSWNINKEAFLSDFSWLELLKLKGSYGSTGNANISDYLHLGTYSFAQNTTYNSNSGTRPARIANPDLTWEKAYTTNLGIEFAIKNIGKVDLDFYNRENKALLQAVPLSAASGFTSVQRNVGTVRNRGIDLNLTTKNIDRTFKWETNFNINVNNNKILELNNNEDIASGDMRMRVGLPMRYWYMREWAGVDPQNGDPLWIRWEDENGRIIHGADKKEPFKIIETNKFNDASLLFIQSAYPDFTGGISNDFYYKNFSVNINCNYVVGNTINFSQRVHIDDDGKVLSKNQMKLHKDWVRWEKPGDVATHPRLLIGGNKQSSENSSRFLEDGSYFRIQSVRFNYIFPYIFSGLRLYASIDNLAVFTKFSGNDPDMNLENPVGSQSAFNEPYGAPRKFLFGIDVTF